MRFRKKYSYEKKPKLTYFLIYAALAVYLAEVFVNFSYGESAVQQMFEQFGFSMQGLLQGRWWVFFTSVFLHASPEHLIVNILALYFFGKVVENELGNKKFFLIFFGSAVLGDMAILSVNLLGLSSPVIPTIGASAAIFGLLGTAMLVKPLEMIFYPFLVPVPLVMVAILYTLYNIGAFLLVLITGKEAQISYIAHLGGLAAGFLFGLREERSRRGLIILLIFILLLIFVPIMWKALGFLENFNYLKIFSQNVG